MYVAKTKALISSAATPSILVSKNLGVMVIVHNVDSDSRNIPFHVYVSYIVLGQRLGTQKIYIALIVSSCRNSCLLGQATNSL